jgi:predicted enzyme related to lactoylglutathione lyase
MHVDIHTPGIEAEATRLAELGATRLRNEPRSEHGANWILLQDPEGNEFCICDAGIRSVTSAGRRWLVQ